MRCAVCRRRVHEWVVDLPGFERAPGQRNTCRCAICWLFEVGRAATVAAGRRSVEDAEARRGLRRAIRSHRRDRVHRQTIRDPSPPPCGVDVDGTDRMAGVARLVALGRWPTRTAVQGGDP